jgi:hypothetical protein
MANPNKERPRKRARGPNVATLIAAAAAAGRHLVGAVTKPGGVVELTFGRGGDDPPPSGDTPEDLKGLL